MADLMANFPYELVLEVSHYLGYSDVQSLRAVCRRVSKILEPFALSRMTLDLYNANQDQCFNFPIDKYRAYSDPTTRGAEHVRHLTINGLCVDFAAPQCSYESETGCDEQLLRLHRPHEHKEVVYRRLKLFYEVIDKLFVSPTFMNLQTVTWKFPPCKMHSKDRDPWQGECCNTLHQLMPLLLRERETPLRRLELVAVDSGTLPRFTSFPICKELYIRGMPTYRPSAREILVYTNWIQESILEAKHLESLDWDFQINDKCADYLFPDEEHDDNTLAFPIRHKTLSLTHWGGRLDSTILGHFRHMRALHINCDDIALGHTSPTQCERSLAPLWLQLVEEQIFVQELRVNLNQLGDSFVNYLASYPAPTLKNLQLRCRPKGAYAHLDTIPERFYKKAWPAIAHGLEDFTMEINEINNWCFGVLPETATMFKNCRVLENVAIMMQPSDDIEKIVREAFAGLSQLSSVQVRIPTTQDGKAVVVVEEIAL
ncbi:hypothetical protein CVT24_004877 [Panaeolus cyanescens]|uniref:F-box domain-containing protein n=1 Tax=Panaeolus cyanescens TaxID=181874 RepID=A0A409VDY4_9AGAR|nr:hypothetical protein CVT24_004877 [Panaeolus cyanescens]